MMLNQVIANMKNTIVGKENLLDELKNRSQTFDHNDLVAKVLIQVLGVNLSELKSILEDLNKVK